MVAGGRCGPKVSYGLRKRHGGVTRGWQTVVAGPPTGEHMAPKILIVEDEADLVETLEYSLGRAGFDTSSATDGREALRLLA